MTDLAFSNTNFSCFDATVHEDNQGALLLANLEPGHQMPRPNHYALCLHWFYFWSKLKKIEIDFIPTHIQKNDMMTKALPPSSFGNDCELSMGW